MISIQIGSKTIDGRKGGLSISKQLGQMGTASIATLDSSITKNDTVKGTPVAITDTNLGTVFTGFVQGQARELLGCYNNWKTLRTIDCIDNRWLLAKYLISVTLSNCTIYDILDDIVSQITGLDLLPSDTLYPSDDLYPREGISYDRSSVPADGARYPGLDQYPGSTRYPQTNIIQDFQYPNEYADTIVQALADLLGAYWNLSEEYKTCIRHPGDVSAPWTLTEADIHIGDGGSNPGVDDANSKYYNRLTGIGTNITNDFSQPFVADGSSKAYKLTYKVAKVPALYVDGVQVDPSLVGIGQVDSGKTWYWNGGNDSMYMDDSASPLTAGTILRVDYTGSFDINLTRSYDSEIARMALIDGTDGVIHRKITVSGMSLAAMTAYLDSQLSKDSVDASSFVVATRRPGLDIGQWLHVQLPDLEIDDDYYLVQKMVMSLLDDGEWVYTVTLIKGPLLDDWTVNFVNKAKT